MIKRLKETKLFLYSGLTTLALVGQVAAQSSITGSWENDLSPIPKTEWNYDRAAHLLERAGFGGTPNSIQDLVTL